VLCSCVEGCDAVSLRLGCWEFESEKESSLLPTTGAVRADELTANALGFQH